MRVAFESVFVAFRSVLVKVRPSKSSIKQGLKSVFLIWRRFVSNLFFVLSWLAEGSVSYLVLDGFWVPF